jgi:hypothetical protein
MLIFVELKNELAFGSKPVFTFIETSGELFQGFNGNLFWRSEVDFIKDFDEHQAKHPLEEYKCLIPTDWPDWSKIDECIEGFDDIYIEYRRIVSVHRVYGMVQDYKLICQHMERLEQFKLFLEKF